MRPILSLLALPLLAVAVASADDAPPVAPPAKPPVVPSAEAPTPAKLPADASPAADSKPPTDAKPAEVSIAWLHDYDAAKTKAASEKKGLFIYMTPSWFT